MEERVGIHIGQLAITSLLVLYYSAMVQHKSFGPTSIGLLSAKCLVLWSSNAIDLLETIEEVPFIYSNVMYTIGWLVMRRYCFSKQYEPAPGYMALVFNCNYSVRSLTTIDLYVGEPELRLELDDKEW